ncbi:hypothetical protein B0H66DRAFT_530520 [Apodospora peruviana]|uniref:Translation initiation factor 3 N-terminal domain-containing protein n=1 Tax=Apodospora peruviana TaxID=516989 RepID=A0AAE0IKM6_9PEZI|nr:hypothetical protein B0H66DRAFT_530520 [Apodospora peruviana]
MRSSQCLFNSAVALRWVFFSTPEVVAPPLQRLLSPLATSSRPWQQQQQSRCCPATTTRRRALSTQRALLYKYRKTKSKANNASALPRDRQIKTEFVHVVKDGQLSPPLRTQQVLRRLDPAVQTLQVVAMSKKSIAPAAEDQDGQQENDLAQEEGEDDGRPEWPVCKILDVKELVAEQAAKKKEERKKSASTKELEINWAIAKGDLNTRLKQLKNFLAKGCTVYVLLMNRRERSKRKASLDEAKETLRAVREAIAQVPGTKEIKPMDGDPGAQVRIALQGPEGGITLESASSTG